MKIRKLKKRVMRLLDPQIVRGHLMRSEVQMHRAFGFVYPQRKNKRTQVVARFGKTTVTCVTPGLIENDLPAEPTPIDPISKNHLLFTEPLRITSAKQFIEVYGSPNMPHVDPPIDPISKSRLVVFETDFSEIKSEPSQMQQWLEDGSAEIVPSLHGTWSIVNKE